MGRPGAAHLRYRRVPGKPADVPTAAKIVPKGEGTITWIVDAGVVVNTSRDIANAGNFSLRTRGLPEQPVEVLASYIGGGGERLVRKMLGPRADELFAQLLPLLLIH